jgi:dipeptidyl aminopeptidase/acylaminoacyl peptidase
MLRSAALAVLASVLSTTPEAWAQLTPEQALDRRAISDLRFSPRGSHLALTVTEPPKGADQNRNIWILDLRSREIKQYTRSPKSDSRPRWSPDGKTLAFLSNREGQAQIYLLPIDGGEPMPLTRGGAAVQSFEWSPDGNQIGFLAPEPKSQEEERKERDKEDTRVVDRDDKLVRLWILDVSSKTIRKVTSNRWRVSEFVWEAGGAKLVAIGTDRPESDENTERLYRVDVATGAFTELAAPRGPIGKLTLAPDGKHVAYLATRLEGPDPHDLFLQSIAGGPARNLTGESIDRLISSYAWRLGGSILAVAELGFGAALYEVNLNGEARRLPIPSVNPADAAVSPLGDVAFVGQTTTEPPEVYVGNSADPPYRFSVLNERCRHVRLTQPELFHYKSFDGTEIEASLLRPPGSPEGVRLPLVVLVHAGPTGRWADQFEAWGQLMVSRGYAVLYPNIRGSTGYGHRFVELNRADWGGGDFRDLMAGADSVIDRGIADPDRLGIGGWSYGGYMSAWAITQTDRFRAAVAVAGMSDLASEFGTEDGPAYDEWFYGLPYEKFDGFHRSSPITYIRQARTPMLLLHGENDQVDPLGQSQQLYRALKRYGVRSELVVYPREPHEFRERNHILDMLGRIVGWFESNLQLRGGP